jgi:hypothetical protein
VTRKLSVSFVRFVITKTCRCFILIVIIWTILLIEINIIVLKHSMHNPCYVPIKERCSCQIAIQFKFRSYYMGFVPCSETQYANITFPFLVFFGAITQLLLPQRRNRCLIRPPDFDIAKTPVAFPSHFFYCSIQFPSSPKSGYSIPYLLRISVNNGSVLCNGKLNMYPKILYIFYGEFLFLHRPTEILLG